LRCEIKPLCESSLCVHLNKHLWRLWFIDSCLLLLKIASRRLGVSRVEHLRTFVLPILCGFLLMSTNFPLWELDEEKGFLVIALPLWDPQWRRTLLCGSELRINSLVSCLLEFIPSSNRRSLFCPDLLLCVVAWHIILCRLSTTSLEKFRLKGFW
jgi:hypothetical protein